MTNPAHHLSKAAEGVRAFNHKSMAAGDDWRYPPNAYTAIGSLSQLTMMLEQAIHQSVYPVTRTQKEGRVVLDSRGDAGAAVAELEEAAREAGRAAQKLWTMVDRMHTLASPMGLDTRGLPEFEDDEVDA
jgi:hypothetical protein